MKESLLKKILNYELPPFIEVVLSKKFITFLIIIFIGILVKFTVNRCECSSQCSDLGYYDFKYVPASRYGQEKCYCLTKQEATDSDNTTKGERIY